VFWHRRYWPATRRLVELLLSFFVVLFSHSKRVFFLCTIFSVPSPFSSSSCPRWPHFNRLPSQNRAVVLCQSRIHWGRQIVASVLKSRYLAHDPVCIIDPNGDLSFSDRAWFTLVQAVSHTPDSSFMLIIRSSIKNACCKCTFNLSVLFNFDVSR
jgi:hypothetical protein